MKDRQASGARQALDGVSPVSGLDIDIMQEAGDWPSDAEEIVRRAAEHAYVVAGPSEDAELCIVLADDGFVQALNKTYRAKDKPTNVLSFPTGGIPFAIGAEPMIDMGPHLLGDVVLAVETITREAAEQGKSFAHHLTHLVVHGVLHLLGQDHEEDADAEEMEAMERDILEDLDIADPYAEDAALNGRAPDA
jgi:probable rRNA maturation factor